MADYIYLLESRLSKDQQHALNVLRELARERGLTIFLVGGAVRDLTSGSPVRDLDVVVQGNALKLKKDIEKTDGFISGESEAGQALFLRFPGSVRVELGSSLTITYPKPGKPVAKPGGILDDLRRRDFTANAMALSLNTGSYGLLMDPLNGVADIENRELRLVSNYGFIEDPIRMVRAARLMARLGWSMDEKTQSRYETGKQEGFISAASAFSRGYEAEEVVHEEDPIRVLKRLESEGWLKEIAPAWTSAKANEAELERLRDSQTQLQLQGIHPSPSAANFPLLTAKMSAGEVAGLKASFPRPGFVREIDNLEAEARELAAQLTSRSTALPSQAWKVLHAAKPEAVLQVAFASKSSAIQAKFKSFLTEWPQARQKVPYTLMQEMRIVPELSGYEAFVESLVFELMDGKLTSPEELKAFLEPFSPPAPPPPVHLRRPRTPKKDAKAGKGRGKKSAAVEGTPEEVEVTKNSQVSDEVTVSAEIAVKQISLPPIAKPLSKKVAQPEKSASQPVSAKAEINTLVPAKTSSAKAGNATSVKTIAARPAPGKAVAPTPTPSRMTGKSSDKTAAKLPAKATGKGHATKKVEIPKTPAKKQAAKQVPAKPAPTGKVAPKSAAKFTAKPLVRSASKSTKKMVAKTPIKPASKKAPVASTKSTPVKKRR